MYALLQTQLRIRCYRKSSSHSEIQIVFDDNLKGALDQVFGGNSGTSASGKATGGNTTNTSSQSLSAALNSAKQALADAQKALAKGDFTAYGKAQDRLKSAISSAISAQGAKK
jgi:uncharacterized membrane protein (UPF0182 family)